ncbi:MAG: transcriptional regulator [Gammaproteobacteria bacterium SG8_31]|nr:MAG: transcriptional regulator [Gammaproteobacteria bacterium SG8_31]
MNHRTIFFVSDQTGITAETLGHSLMTQFDGLKFRSVTVPFIDSLDKARETVNRINLTAEVEGARPIVFATLIEDDVRAILSESKGLFLDFFDAFIGPLERELEVRSTHTVGKAHGVANTTAYARRIDAMNFALENDDGANTRNYNRADVILTGVSRSGKTPTCLYLALHYGIFPANYPLAEEEFETGKLPETLEKFRDKLYGLTISSDRLQQVRGERRPGSRYASAQQVNFELRSAEALFRKNGIPYLDTTECSIEEIASTILHRRGLLDRNGDRQQSD